MASIISDLIFWLCIVLPCLCLFNLISRKTSNLPPGPAGFPVIGSLLSLFQLGSSLHESLATLSQQYGPIMTVRLGSRTTVVVSSAEMAEEVLHRQNQVFSGRTVPDVDTNFGYDRYSLAFCQIGPRWKALRRMCNNEMFTRRRLEALGDLREEKVRALIQHVRQAADEGRAIDISECALATTLNLIACTLFSQDLADLDSESPGEFKRTVCEAFELNAEPNLSDFFPILRWIDLQGLRRRSRKHLTRMYHIYDEIIDKHLRAYEIASAKGEPKRKEDFLDVLLELTRDPTSGFTRENIRPLLEDIIIAGSESSATTIEWAMTELLRHPNKLAAARSELKRIIGMGSFVKESDIENLPYLDAVMKETLRLHPPGPLLLPRRADATTKVAGYTIPKHAQVLVNVWAISNDAMQWDKPTCFIPERFFESDVNYKGKHFQFIPFGAGKRICPGIPLASRMVLLVLASLINSFSWVLPNQMDLEQLDAKAKFKLVLQKENPLKVIPSPLMKL